MRVDYTPGDAIQETAYRMIRVLQIHSIISNNTYLFYNLRRSLYIANF